ncbi:MAG TPA: hypothetical protein VFG69_09795 [Nannocystaceae bacterium]|nr:hypothetical protein [Nannocystaceae bacterium]
MRRSQLSLLLFFDVLAACSDAAVDPTRDPPGHSADDSDTSGGDEPTDDGADDGSTDAGETGQGSSSGDDEAMPCEQQCRSDAPSGWHGPAALIRTSAAEPVPECGSSHPVELATLVSDLIAPAAECDCNCGAAQDVECNDAIARVFDSASCSGVAQDSFAIGLSCAEGPLPIEGHWQVEFAPPSGGECAALPSTTIGDVDYTRWTLCGAQPLAGECGFGESCSPAPGDEFEASECIWIEGDVACPAADYTERTLVHGEVVDDRSCGECSCSKPMGTCAGGEVLLDLQETCDMSASIALWYATPGDCLGEIYFESGMITEAATPFASCNPTMPLALGSATLDDPFTVCCAP